MYICLYIFIIIRVDTLCLFVERNDGRHYTLFVCWKYTLGCFYLRRYEFLCVLFFVLFITINIKLFFYIIRDLSSRHTVRKLCMSCSNWSDKSLANGPSNEWRCVFLKERKKSRDQCLVGDMNEFFIFQYLHHILPIFVAHLSFWINSSYESVGAVLVCSGKLQNWI